MAKRLTDDEIKWVLSLDAKGVQSELKTLSSKSEEYAAKNRELQADLKETGKWMKEAEKAMDKMAKKGDTTSKAYTDASNAFNQLAKDAEGLKKQIEQNNRSIEENKRKTDDIVRTMRVEDMTMEQLERRAKNLALQLRKTSQSADPVAYEALENKLKAVNYRMSELKNGSHSTFTVFKGGMAVLAGNLMTKGIDKVRELISAGKEWVMVGVDMARSSEGVINFFNQIPESNRLLKEMKESTYGAISSLELMKKALRAKEMGIPIQDMAKLMEYARIQAQKLGKDVDYMSDSIVDGIGRKSTLVLDNLGLSATEVQRAVKKSGDFTQGVLKIVNDELEKTGPIALTSADKAAQAAAKMEDAQLKVGQKFKWIGEIWDRIKGKIADGISNLIGETKSLTQQYDDQLEKVADLEINSVKLAKRYEELKSKSSLTKDEQFELNQIMNTLSTTIPGVVSEWDKYGNVLSINTDKVYDFIEAEKARLQFINRDAIDKLQKDIKYYQNEMDVLQKRSTSGQIPYLVPSGRGPSQTQYREMSDQEKMENIKQIAALKQKILGAEAELSRLTGKTIEEQITAQQELVKKRAEFNEMNKEALKAWIDDEKNAKDEYLNIAQQVYDSRFGTNPDVAQKPKGKTESEEQEQKKALNLLLEQVETNHQERMADIRQRYAHGSIKSESAYERELFSQQQAAYTLREEALKGFLEKVKTKTLKSDINKQLAEINNKRLDDEIKYRKQIEKIILDASPRAKEDKEYAERLDAAGLFGLERKDLTAEQLKVLELLEQQHQDNISRIDKAGKAKRKADSEAAFKESFSSRKEEMQLELNELQVQAATLSGSSAFDAEMAVHMKRLQMISEEIEARKAAGLETVSIVKQIGQVEAQMTNTLQNENTRRISLYNQYATTMGTAFGEVLSGQKSAFDAFGNSMIDILFDILTQIVNAKIMEATATAVAEQAKAAAIAAALPDSVISFGASAAARTAVISAIIMGALTAAKISLKGLIGKKGKSSDSKSSSGGNSFTGSITARQRFASGGYNDAGIQGGYTGDGGRYEIKGYFPNGNIYDAGEYIVPQPVMKMPAAIPLIRGLEAMRQQYSTNNPLPERFADGGFNSNVAVSETHSADPVILEVLELLRWLKTNGVQTYLGMSELDAKMQRYYAEQERYTNKRYTNNKK